MKKLRAKLNFRYQQHKIDVKWLLILILGVSGFVALLPIETATLCMLLWAMYCGYQGSNENRVFQREKRMNNHD